MDLNTCIETVISECVSSGCMFWSLMVVLAGLVLLVLAYYILVFIKKSSTKKSSTKRSFIKRFSIKKHYKIVFAVFLGYIFALPSFFFFDVIRFDMMLQIVALPIILGGLMALFGRKYEKKDDDKNKEKKEERRGLAIDDMGGEELGWVLIGSGVFMLLAAILEPLLTIVLGKYILSMHINLIGRTVFYTAIGFFLTCMIRIGIGGNVRDFIIHFFSETG